MIRQQRGWRGHNESNNIPVRSKEYNNPWWKQASCQGLDIDLCYSDEIKQKPPITVARMCFDCPVKVTCRLAGYAEYWGQWGNTGPFHRKEYRHAIFRRLFARELDADDDLSAFRRALYDLIERDTDVLKTMREVGFTKAEIDLFLEDTYADTKARESDEKQDTFTTKDQTFVRLMKGQTYAGT